MWKYTTAQEVQRFIENTYLTLAYCISPKRNFVLVNKYYHLKLHLTSTFTIYITKPTKYYIQLAVGTMP